MKKIFSDTEPLFYKTPRELLIDHSFEPLLEWINNQFTPSHVLELRKIRGATEAIIIDTRKPASEYAYRREAFEILARRLVSISGKSLVTDRDIVSLTTIPVIKEKGNGG